MGVVLEGSVAGRQPPPDIAEPFCAVIILSLPWHFLNMVNENTHALYMSKVCNEYMIVFKNGC